MATRMRWRAPASTSVMQRTTAWTMLLIDGSVTATAIDARGAAPRWWYSAGRQPCAAPS
jgi:hypothetical protein